jgi:hypothetical protein
LTPYFTFPPLNMNPFAASGFRSRNRRPYPGSRDRKRGVSPRRRHAQAEQN